MIEGQILQALGEGQFLLDGHAQEGVQSLLLILGCSQLSLHLVQLGHILVTPEEIRKENQNEREGQANLCLFLEQA